MVGEGAGRRLELGACTGQVSRYTGLSGETGEQCTEGGMNIHTGLLGIAQREENAFCYSYFSKFLF